MVMTIILFDPNRSFVISYEKLQFEDIRINSINIASQRLPMKGYLTIYAI